MLAIVGLGLVCLLVGGILGAIIAIHLCEVEAREHREMSPPPTESV